MQKRAALGFRVHTGWAALVAVEGPVSLVSPTILDRRGVEMIERGNPEAPAFVYHAAAKLSLKSAEQLVQESAQLARSRARNALATSIRELSDRGYDLVASGVIVGNRPVGSSSLEAILAAHSLIHAAEGELFRQAVIGANEDLKLPVTTVPARALYARASKISGGSVELTRQRLADAGRRLGKPWTQDQKESLLVALLAFADSLPPARPGG